MSSSIPYITLFSSSLILRTLISISSNQWIYIWIGLELNLLSFIPLVTRSSIIRETEAAVKYFLAQAIGSGILLLGAFNKFIIFSDSSIVNNEKISGFLIFTALLIKIGAAPCHFWFPLVIRRISWPLCILLSTWQKIAPITILIYRNILAQTTLILLVASFGRLVGGVGGINQTQLRPLLAYSSVGHIGWILATPSFSTLVFYLNIYIILSIAIISLLWLISSKQWAPKISIKYSNPAYTISLIILLFSLGGLPPFLGFLPKWIVLTSLVNSSISILWPVIIIIGSVIQLYYYINLIFTLFLKTASLTPQSGQTFFSINQIFTLLGSVTLGISPLFLII